MAGLYYPSLDDAYADRIKQIFGALEPGPAELPDELSFVFLCFTNRCGSNYLAEIMSSGGEFNTAGEFLNPVTIRQQQERHAVASLQEYFAFLAARQARAGHLFIKVGVPHLEVLGKAGLLAQVLPRAKFVLIERADKLAQAISHVLAFKTRRFKSTGEERMPAEAVAFSAPLIDKALTLIFRSYQEFDAFFGHNGIVPVYAIYEQLIDSPGAYAEFLARQLGLSGFRYAPETLRLERQANAINAAWREQYLSHRA